MYIGICNYNYNGTEHSTAKVADLATIREWLHTWACTPGIMIHKLSGTPLAVNDAT